MSPSPGVGKQPFGTRGDYGLSLALALHVPAPTIYDIVKEERGISPEMALRLGYVFGTTPDFWLNLQSEFDLRCTKPKRGHDQEPGSVA